MKLLVDGDPLVYRSIFSVGESAPLCEVTEKYSGYVSEIFQNTIPDPSPSQYTIYLTGSGNYRDEIAKSHPYKGQRPVKPIHVGPVKQYVLDNFVATISDGEEADDLIAIEATRLGPNNCVIVSIDKDFLQVPATIYNPTKNVWYKVDEWSGLVFFYTQILTGDRVDNIHGLPGIGPKKGEGILKGASTEKELFNAVLEAYDGDYERVIENARLLWLRRFNGQIWEPPK